jgi:hypothetical protein
VSPVAVVAVTGRGRLSLVRVTPRPVNGTAAYAAMRGRVPSGAHRRRKVLLVRTVLARRSRGEPGHCGVGPHGNGVAARPSDLRGSGAPDIRWTHATPEQNAGAAGTQRVKVGEAT